MKSKIAIHWFRQDLRLADNPALNHAANYQNVLPIYILDDENAREYAMGSASKWWLHHSLHALNISLGNKLSVYSGNPATILADIITRFEVEAVCWNRCYEPWQIDRDRDIEDYLTKSGVDVYAYNGSLLWEPNEIYKDDGTPYQVFTPFFRKGCISGPKPRYPLSKIEIENCVLDSNQKGIDKLDLLPKNTWYTKYEPYWQVGEIGAQKRFKNFLETGITSYKHGRDIPAKYYVSRISPHLHFGEISPNQLWYGVQDLGDDKNIDHFCSELVWREFSYNLLYHNPALPHKNLQSKFNNFPWDENLNYLYAWQEGKTGIPMVDAGMRELWHTGYMHNRVRMIVGSFLVKNLRLHWHYGERWFWDTLVDADLANNSASWQWIAGCGADAAPYFRIFNPVMQGQKFDPQGEYIRKYVPEIATLPDQYLFSPWEAPASVLQKADIALGATYPYPIIDLKKSREEALIAFQSLKQHYS